MPLKVGDDAPDFKTNAVGGKEVSLSDFTGKSNVVLFFFPLAFSPVCSKEVTDFERNLAKIKEAGAEVLGLSVDSVFALSVWAASVGGLAYPLATDIKREIGQKYGVFMAERGFNGRAIFVIGKDGKIKWMKQYEPKQQPDLAEVVAEVQKLK